jgi:FkbM family methyltransferase
MIDSLDTKLQQLYKKINEILPTLIEFDQFTLKVDKSGASIYKQEDQILFSQNKCFEQIHQKYSPKIVLDVGANIGFSTLVFSKFFPDAHIIAIEPNPKLIGIIQENLRNNNIENVSIVNKVVGEDPEDIVSFQINNIMSVDSRVQGLKNNYEHLTIESTSIDKIIVDFGCDNDDGIFIKIDTQGFEERVINGAKKTLTDFSNYCVMMEFAPFWLKESSTDPISFLGYLLRNYSVCEFPSRSLFFPETLEQIQKNLLIEEDAQKFVSYTENLRRNEKGWCDLMIFKNGEL